MGTKTWVILNSARVVNEIIAKRGGITHERPHFPIVGEILSRNKRVFLRKTKDWREPRRILQQLVTERTKTDHNDIVEKATLGLLLGYLEEPELWYSHNYRFSLSVMYELLIAKPLQQSRDELQNLQRVTSTFLTSINSSWVEFFPMASKLPKALQFWRAHWEKISLFEYNTFRRWWRFMVTVADPDAKPSFLRDTILKEYSGSMEDSMYLTMLAMSAGSDNPRMAVNAWVMAALAYPAAIQKAREEMDSVCGTKALRLPTLNDLPNLPYTCAVVKELLRWRPIVPLTPQRVLVRDLDFEGYKFPAGTEFLTNSIAVCHEGYERADEFWPERWLQGDGDIEQSLWQFAFGGGKRFCVGYRLAQKELFSVFSRLSYCFNFHAVGPVDDKQLRPFSPGEPFPVKIVARSADHERLIRREATDL